MRGNPGLEDLCEAESVPLTLAQREVWREHLLFPHSAVHTVSACSWIQGPIDPAVLEQALGVLWQRHQALRFTPFSDASGEPRQIEVAKPDCMLERFDLSHEADPHAASEALAEELGRRPIALDGGVTFRFSLIHASADHHMFVGCYHHINMDAWANGILLRELATVYSALQQGRVVDLAEAPRYDQAVAADQAFVGSSRWLKNGDYWSQRYTRLPDPLVDAIPRVLQGQPPSSTHLRRLTVTGKQMDLLRGLAQNLSTTTARLFTAAGLILLRGHSGAEEVAFGLAVHNRGNTRDKATFGLFSLTTAPRVRIESGLELKGLLARLDRAIGEAIRHARYPLSEINRRLGLATRRRLQLFDLNISYERVDYAELLFDQSRAQPPRVLLNGVERTPVELFVREYGDADRVEVDLDLSSEAFSSERADQLARQLANLIDCLSNGVQGPISAAWLLAPEERYWLLAEVNATDCDYGDFIPLAQRFEAQVVTSPDAPALRFDGIELSYAELNQRANGLARRLQRAGVGAEGVVALALDRSVELVVALLAVIKAGGAYLPLDPGLPQERQAYMLADADAAVLITHSGLLDRLPGHAGRTLLVDDRERGGRRAAAGNPEVPVRPEQLAYILYTSGSTGQPKGVMSQQRGLENRLLWMQQRFAIGRGDRILQKTPYSFDVSVWEFFWPLITGACLVLARPGAHRDPDYLARLLDEERISCLHFVPSMLKGFLGHPPAAERLSRCQALRQVICSGEALPAALVDSFYRSAPANARLHNLYGPTEAAIDVSHWPCSAPAEEPVPIGHAIANTRLYVLDSQLEPVPVGVAGDLWIGGVQLARGYLKRPGLSAERFMADPHSPNPGARMYHSGDRARRRADGALIYLGRSDQQIKLRGQRIELGEIEARLQQQAEIRDAAVSLREDRPGDQRLVAYWVSREPILASELQRRLRAQLPEYMIPGDWVELDQLPLNASGKLDRKALPAPEQGSRGEGGQPQSPEEEICCLLFAEVLGCETVGVEENFFALGGHSLLAVQLVGRLRQILAVELSANALFAWSTPRELARRISTLRRNDGASLSPRPPRSRRLATATEAQLWALQQRHPKSVAYLMAAAVEIEGALDAPALVRALAAVQMRHPLLHSLFVESDQGLWLQPRPDRIEAVEVEQVDSYGADCIEQVETAHAFLLDSDLPMRVRLLQLGQDSWRLLLLLHHVAADADSIGLLGRALEQVYLLAVVNPDVPAATLAQRLPQPSNDPMVLEERLDFSPEGTDRAALRRWTERLRGLSGASPLPHWSAGDGGVRVQRLMIEADLRHALGERSKLTGATPFLLLHTALAVALYRFGGNNDLVIGVPVSQRGEAALTNTIGMLLNTLPLRVQIDPNESLLALLGRARSGLMEALADAAVPLTRIIEAWHEEGAGEGSAPFQVLLTTHAPHLRELQLGETEVRVRILPQLQAKMDLALLCADDGIRMDIIIEHASGLFPPGGVEAFAEALEQILLALAECPETSVGGVTLFSAHSTSLQAEVSGPDAVDSRPAPGGSLAQRFAEMVALHADLPALEGVDGRQLSYAELDRYSDALAAGVQAHLKEGNGRRGEPVGVSMQRGLEQICLFLAVIKAGGAYVPLDPEQPGSRLAEMAEDAGIRLVVTDRGRPDWLAEGTVCIDFAQLAQSETAFQPVVRSGADAAYLMFTSGSTGRPKGIRIPQRAVLRLALEPGFAEFAPGKRLAQIATTAFDAATYEIWCALLNGATCVVIEREASYQAEALAAAFNRARVHSSFLTVSVFNRAVFASADAFSGCQEIIFGGEAADVAAVCQARRRWPHVRFINGYGPTETTTFAAFYTASDVDETDSGIPIGGPIRATALYVLDEQLQPVPRGVTGELWIGGEGLADGYLGAPAFTAERFLADPFSPIPGVRMYRTGDRVRRRPDGALDYLGRIDRQIKLRGMRIEPGEIEAALRSVTGAEQVVVEVRQREPGDRALYAWVLCPQEIDATTRQVWRSALGERLPAWMVPRQIQPLTVFPLTPNGKLDRDGLGLPAADECSPESRGYANDTEQMLAEIWSELLGSAGFRREVSFFAAGGHSLLGVQLAARIRQTFAVDLHLRNLFARPRLSEMAESIDRARIQTDGLLEEIAPCCWPGDERPVAPMQARLALMQRIDGASLAYSVPLVYVADGVLDVRALRAALRDLAERHEPLRTVVVVGETVSGHLLTAEQILLHEEDHPQLAPDALAKQLSERAAELAREPFDLTEEAPLRAWLLRCGPAASALILVLHHIAVDGHSLVPLLRDLARLYRARLQGESTPLPPLPLVYADWVQWRYQGQRADGDSVALERALQQLRGALTILELPTDFPRPAQRSHLGGVARLDLDEELEQRLRLRARALGVTPFALLSTAFALLLGRMANSQDVLLGIPFDAREQAQTADMVGFFADTAVLRVE
ncbi:MAG: amino acid adenylation domain-containing protein, partial [Gammaproteobacteria bacterium]|nr:amino acid adenylation domain-containing protein [Gammaproteobacteria bacterium]